ncbi:MAG: S8 family serine peptidase, partial [Anaerolineae bacterium]|nr:S8 family serine peptidase [Anaerolineae bacterium]
TPHVTGAIAQLLEAYSTESPWILDWPEMVKAMLLATAVDVGGDTDYYGHGLL